MPDPSRRVVVALDHLTTQVRRIADALTTAAAQGQTAFALAPPPADDAPSDAACRRMETRTCPKSYNGPCGDRPCARFESDAPAPWTDTAAPAIDEELRAARRESLRVLFSRVQRGLALTPDEARLLVDQTEAEIGEADTAHSEAAYYQQLSAEQGREVSRALHTREEQRQRTERSEAAAERVRALATGEYYGITGRAFLAALDAPSSPTTTPDQTTTTE